MYPCPRAVAITPPECSAASVSLRRSMLPSPYGPLELGFSVATYAFTFVTARGLAHHPKDGFVNRLHSLRFLHECDSSYRGLTFPLVGAFPTEYISLFFGHTGRGLSPPSCRASSAHQQEGRSLVGPPYLVLQFAICGYRV